MVLTKFMINDNQNFFLCDVLVVDTVCEEFHRVVSFSFVNRESRNARDSAPLFLVQRVFSNAGSPMDPLVQSRRRVFPSCEGKEKSRSECILRSTSENASRSARGELATAGPFMARFNCEGML